MSFDYEQLEQEYINQFVNVNAKNIWNIIPNKIRKIIISDFNLRPYDKRNGNAFRIAEINDEEKGYVFLTNIQNNMLEIHVLPTPTKNSSNKSWYNIETLKKTIEKELHSFTNINSLLDKITYYEKPDGSNCCLKLQKLTWKEAESVIPIVVRWSKENQKNKRLPVEIIECLNKLDCTPQYTRKDNDRTIPCKHNKTGKLIIWILRPNIEKDTYGIRTPDIKRDLEWYNEGDFTKQLPQNIIFRHDKNKGRWIVSGLSKNEILKCLPILVNWMLENKITDEEKSDFIFSEEIDEMSKSKELEKLLKNTHNLILHGAPGTGKTYLAKEIAKKMGCTEKEIGFVQFHSSYDYTDFVEGLRPLNDENGNTVFEKIDGVFKKFCLRALSTEKQNNFDEAFEALINEVRDSNNSLTLHTPTGADFKISVNNRNNFTFYTGADNKIGGSLTKKGIKTEYEGHPFYKYWLGYYKGVIDYLKEHHHLTDEYISSEKNYVFIIDEINRGEMGKIFGELFYSIDPSYRVNVAEITEDNVPTTVITQYASMDTEPNDFDDFLGEKINFGHFFIPHNVYIIGTMNDIDRSVESMDLAMRRRFTFKEITAEDSMEMLDNPESWMDTDISTLPIDEMKTRMINLNNEIISEEIGLSSAYQIGAAYFLKYAMYKDEIEPFDCLWEYNLEPLLQEYLRGQSDVKEKMDRLKTAYDNK